MMYQQYTRENLLTCLQQVTDKDGKTKMVLPAKARMGWFAEQNEGQTIKIEKKLLSCKEGTAWVEATVSAGNKTINSIAHSSVNEEQQFFEPVEAAQTKAVVACLVGLGYVLPEELTNVGEDYPLATEQKEPPAIVRQQADTIDDIVDDEAEETVEEEVAESTTEINAVLSATLSNVEQPKQPEPTEPTEPKVEAKPETVEAKVVEQTNDINLSLDISEEKAKKLEAMYQSKLKKYGNDKLLEICSTMDIQTGTFKGKTLGEAATEKPSYLRWLIEKCATTAAGKAAYMYMRLTTK